jgi:hypothetical protein
LVVPAKLGDICKEDNCEFLGKVNLQWAKVTYSVCSLAIGLRFAS